MQYQASLITADGAYHCPVGSIMAIFSSVRSSYSHPDLLLIHHPPHHPLFQITPVLDTGLSLSEPLQLYKGYNAIYRQNLARLWHTLEYSGILWHTLAYSGILWHTLANSCIFWHTLTYYGILWHTPAYSGILWHTLAYFGIPWHTLAYSGILWHALAYSGIPWHTLVYSGILLNHLAPSCT